MDEKSSNEEKYRMALMSIIYYDQIIQKRPILNYEFKKYAIFVARNALGPENGELPADYKANIEKLNFTQNTQHECQNHH